MSTRALFAGVRSAVYATAFWIFWGYIALAFRHVDPSPLPAWCTPVGLSLAALGGALALASIGRFVVSGEGTPMPLDAPRKVVRDGPYRWVRNPMYVGGCTLLAGAGLALRSPGMLVFTLIFWLIADAFVRFYEEPALTARFGAAYDEYRRRVPRWIPRRPRESR